MKYPKILLLCFTFLIVFVLTTEAYAESGYDFVRVEAINEYQPPTGSTNYVYTCATDFRPALIVFMTPDNAKRLYVGAITSGQQVSPYYKITIAATAIDYYLPDRDKNSPVTLRIVGFKDDESITYTIPNNETVIYPVPGCYEILEPYKNPRNNQYKYHHGVDIVTPPEGVPIIAATSGVFIFAGECPERSWYGQHVIIEHKSGDKIYHHIYGHLSKIEIDDTWIAEISRNPGCLLVPQGAVIGISGNSGCQKHHLHYEVRDVTDGGTSVHSAIDPFSLFGLCSCC